MWKNITDAAAGRSRRWSRRSVPALLLLLLALCPVAQVRGEEDAPVQQGEVAPPPPGPASVSVRDRAWDDGSVLIVEWTPPAGEVEIDHYLIYRERTEQELLVLRRDLETDAVTAARSEATEAILGEEWSDSPLSLSPEVREEVRSARAAAAAQARDEVAARWESEQAEHKWLLVTVQLPEDGLKAEVDLLGRGESYRVAVSAVRGGAESALVEAPSVGIPRQWPFDGQRLFVLIFLMIFGGAVVVYIMIARSGKPLKVRKIAGLEAIDEAVGRATEMGRSVLFVPGIQDMNEIQTIAGITVLSRVAKVAAEYDAKVEVPTARSLVMTTARETVQAAFLAAGRPDAYNEDLIYYVTDEQFGYVAYLSGMMVREKPAACIYMGMFYAESLILAETGNAIGAIQVAGTAQPAQLPFFVAACDYTLIGEEFFAASAYLSGSPEELGSLKGQDVGKVVVAVIVLIGVTTVTLSAMLGPDSSLGQSLAAAASYLQETVLR